MSAVAEMSASPAPAALQDERLLDVADLSRLFGRSPVTIWRWTRDGSIPAPVTRIGQAPFWKRSQFADVFGNS